MPDGKNEAKNSTMNLTIDMDTLEKGAVRISVGYNNKNADVEKLIDAIREISKS